MFKRLAGALAALCLLVAAAVASIATTSTTLSTSAYTDLGAGPLMLSVNGGALVYQIADSQPSAGSTGIGLSLGQVPVALTTTSHVWATALSGPSVSAVAWPIAAQAVSTAGSGGADYSANKPALPNVGSNFGSSGPYANYVLIATAAANPARSAIDIENISGAQIAVVRDDGTAAGGAAPANASVFALAGGVAAGAQGGAWSSQTFKGRLQIYALSSGAIVAVMGD